MLFVNFVLNLSNSKKATRQLWIQTTLIELPEIIKSFIFLQSYKSKQKLKKEFNCTDLICPEWII